MPIAASCGGDDSSSSIAGTGGGAATDASATGDGAATQDGSLPDGTPPPDGEVVAFMHSDGYAVLIEAKENATPRNLSTALDALSPGDDEAVAISLDGTHLALSTTRFGCGGWACLALVTRDLASGQAVAPAGEVLHPERAIAIGPNGGWIVYAARGDTHDRDLFITHRSNAAWSAPQRLTGASTHAYNMHPAPSYDGAKIVFDCAPVPYGAQGTSVCEAKLDGTGFRQVQSPGQSSWSADALALHHPAYAPDGSIVFEMNRADVGEQIWRLPAGSNNAVMVGDFGNDNSPCVLSNGWIASLYLERPDNTTGSHELKIMSPTGSSWFMALIDTNILDEQLSCGR